MIEQLSPEQVRSWTRLQEHTWWLERVYRGGMPLDALYSGQAAVGLVRAKLLLVSASLAAAYQLLMSDGWMRLLPACCACSAGPGWRSPPGTSCGRR